MLRGDLFIGARTPDQRGTADVTVATFRLVDVRAAPAQDRTGTHTVLAKLFDIPSAKAENINIRFHSYPPSDFAVGGRLLVDAVPRIGRLFKRLTG